MFITQTIGPVHNRCIVLRCSASCITGQLFNVWTLDKDKASGYQAIRIRQLSLTNQLDLHLVFWLNIFGILYSPIDIRTSVMHACVMRWCYPSFNSLSLQLSQLRYTVNTDAFSAAFTLDAHADRRYGHESHKNFLGVEQCYLPVSGCRMQIYGHDKWPTSTTPLACEIVIIGRDSHYSRSFLAFQWS